MVELDEASILLITSVVVVFGTPILLKLYHLAKKIQSASMEKRQVRGRKKQVAVLEDEWDFEKELAEELGLNTEGPEAQGQKHKSRAEGAG